MFLVELKNVYQELLCQKHFREYVEYSTVLDILKDVKAKHVSTRGKVEKQYEPTKTQNLLVCSLQRSCRKTHQNKNVSSGCQYRNRAS